MIKTVLCHSVRNWRVLANQVTNYYLLLHLIKVYVRDASLV